jgi:hypothetical protein
MANTLLLKTYDGGNDYANANTDASVYTVPSAKTTIVIGFMISNLTTNTIVVGVKITDNDASQTVNFMKNISVPSGSSLEIMGGNKMILNTSDILKVTADTANSFDVTLSIVEQDV